MEKGFSHAVMRDFPTSPVEDLFADIVVDTDADTPVAMGEPEPADTAFAFLDIPDSPLFPAESGEPFAVALVSPVPEESAVTDEDFVPPFATMEEVIPNPPTHTNGTAPISFMKPIMTPTQETAETYIKLGDIAAAKREYQELAAACVAHEAQFNDVLDRLATIRMIEQGAGVLIRLGKSHGVVDLADILSGTTVLLFLEILVTEITNAAFAVHDGDACVMIDHKKT